MTDAVTGPASLSSLLGPTPAAQASTTGSTSLDKDAFLKLLVAQMKYQDPTKPTDTSQFMAQMAQMTQVETLQNIKDDLDKSSSWQRAVTAASLVGKQVTGLDAAGTSVTGTVTGARMTSAGPVLKVGTDEVAADQILSLAEAGAATTP